MATYKQIFGKQVKFLSSDPTNESEGQIWYNSTSGTFKSTLVSEAWSSGSSTINAARGRFGTGTQTAALLFGGRTAPTTNITAAEEYNGSGWATGGVLTTARRTLGGAGTQTASLAIGGFTTIQVTTVEEYNGASWTASPALAVKKGQNGAFGTTAAAVTEGGAPAPAAFEVWNNVSWSAGPGPIGPANRFGSAGSGTETAGLFSGGHPASPTDNMDSSLEYNGTAFSAGGTLNTGRGYMGAFGIQTATLGGGGYSTTQLNVTESYDGATWTTSPATLGTAAYNGGAAGTTTAGILAGAGPAYPSNTELWNKSANVITAATWAAGTSLPVERGVGGGCGTTTAALQCGGLGTPPATVDTTFEYDGSWTAGGALPGVRRNNSVFGTQTAAVSAGNLPAANNVDLYNGASWTTGTVYPAVAMDLGVAGTQTAGLAWGGNQDPGLLSTTNEYNGSWTGGGAYPAGSSASGCLGTQTAALSIGGLAPGGVNTTFEYNGASWGAGGTYPITVSHTGGAGTQTAGLGFAGYLLPGVTGLTNGYDGTAWSTRATMGTARYQMTQGLGATNTAALAVGGQTPPRVATVEEYSGETSAVNYKTITTS